MSEELTHIRYIVYLNDKKERQVALWVAKGEPTHDTYARAHHIAIQDFCAGGYIGVQNGKWIIYEHYPVSDEGKALELLDKELVMKSFQNFPQKDDEHFKVEMAKTYQQEKHLLLYALKKMFVKEKN